MNKEILFAQKLGEIRELAKEQGNYVTKEQIADAFAELNFQEEQFQMVYDYLTKHKIGIDEPVDLDEYLSEDEVDYLKMYEEELAAMESVTAGQREAILLSAMAGETDAKKRLVEIYLPQVIEISKLYTGQGVYIEDLVGEGNLALAQGVTMLGCLEHAKEAEGMLMKLVMDAMEDCIAENMQEAEKDKKVLGRVNKVASKAKELAEDMHRKVTVQELSEETGISRKAIEDAMRISGYTIEDLERQS